MSAMYSGTINKLEAADCTVTLTGSGGTSASLQTDEFGDFWFERQEPGTYSLRFEKKGYLTRTMDDIEVEKDINVGDIELYCSK